MTLSSVQPPLLTDAQKHLLLDVARAAVVARVRGAAPVTAAAGLLPEASGAFVTLTRQGELRGCLGTLECRDGLAEEVARCAANAASRDTRFAPVSARELEAIDLEISVLGPLERIDPLVPDAIVVGRHGLVAAQGWRRGLLLPQVATEHGWTVEQFLSHTCVKAGLAPDAWRRGAQIDRFEAEVFGERRPSA